VDRDEKAWLTLMDRRNRAEGKMALRIQSCLECGAAVATRLMADPPRSCAEHDR
jgi:hypothetical protein